MYSQNVGVCNDLTSKNFINKKIHIDFSIGVFIS